MSSPNEKLYDLLQQQCPQRVLAVGHSAIPALETYCREHDCKVVATADPAATDINDFAQQDLVLIADWLEHHDIKEGRLLLGALRNRLNPRIVIAVDEGRSGWRFTDFIGLGFRREGLFSQGDQQLSLYSYDIASYNQKRAWNTPENWANPQNWGKYWW